MPGHRPLLIGVLVFALLAGGGWQPRWLSSLQAGAAGETAAFSDQPYAAVLARFVDAQGRVDYAGLQAHRGELDEFVAALARVEPREMASWTAEQKIALWINAYNALTLRAIIDHYPIRASLWRSVLLPRNSIRQIPGVWDKMRFAVAGREMTLDEIEHDTLRAQFNEPRIHAALVCAAVSCPPLRREPFTAGLLDRQLDDQARVFLRSPHGLRIDRRRGVVHLSSIFQWFGEDFLKTYGAADQFAGRSATERAVLNFVSRHLDEADRNFLLQGRYAVRYLYYDWSLNEASR